MTPADVEKIESEKLPEGVKSMTPAQRAKWLKFMALTPPKKKTPSDERAKKNRVARRRKHRRVARQQRSRNR